MIFKSLSFRHSRLLAALCLLLCLVLPAIAAGRAKLGMARALTQRTAAPGEDAPESRGQLPMDDTVGEKLVEVGKATPRRCRTLEGAWAARWVVLWELAWHTPRSVTLAARLWHPSDTPLPPFAEFLRPLGLRAPPFAASEQA